MFQGLEKFTSVLILLGKKMSANNNTNNLLKIHLADNFIDKKFTVRDLKDFASRNDIPAKSLTHAFGYLCRVKLIEKAGTIFNPHGGNDLIVYTIHDLNRLVASCSKKTTSDYEEEKQSKMVSMAEAANNLEAAFARMI
jgi:hypothetical protein